MHDEIDELLAVVHVELGVDVAHMALDGIVGHAKLLGNIGAASPCDEKGKHFRFALREKVPVRKRRDRAFRSRRHRQHSPLLRRTAFFRGVCGKGEFNLERAQIVVHGIFLFGKPSMSTSSSPPNTMQATKAVLPSPYQAPSNVPKKIPS